MCIRDRKISVKEGEKFIKRQEAIKESLEAENTLNIDIAKQEKDAPINESSKRSKPAEETNTLAEEEKENQEETNNAKSMNEEETLDDQDKLSLIHICRCRRYAVCRSRWSPDH
eukprot:TRINITY_DN26423_c0_g1_i1.p2 TRINITY_DN26423_c0_g1~~TRINITY_DN26423_c0_g1_i1.p2  ORF type:complete len:114 (+),score=34.83 TRINITY_DN26423_c0_g1_i1:75-416(+)